MIEKKNCPAWSRDHVKRKSSTLLQNTIFHAKYYKQQDAARRNKKQVIQSRAQKKKNFVPTVSKTRTHPPTRTTAVGIVCCNNMLWLSTITDSEENMSILPRYSTRSAK